MKKIEEKRRESEEQFFNTFEQAAAGMCHFALDERFIRVNGRFCEIMGYTRDEMMNVTFRDITHPDDLDSDKEFVRQILNNNLPAYYVGKRCLHKNGGVLHISLGVSLVRDSRGHPKYLMGVVEDITERRQSEQALHRFSQVVEQCPITVVITDTKGDIEYVNTRFTELTGYTREEAIGINPRIMKSGKTTPDEYRILWETILSGNTWHGEFYNKKKNGDFFWEKAAISPICNEEGKITHFVALKEDITARKQAEQAMMDAEKQLRQAKDAADAASSMKREFVANMSHELRTPMNGIIGMACLLMDTALTQEQQEYVEMIRHSSDMLLAVISDVLDFSKIEAGKLELEEVDCDLRKVMAGISNILTQEARAKGLELTCSIDDTLPSCLRGDAVRLRQVLLNLGGNAVKFTKEGNISLRVVLDGASGDRMRVRFSVADTGIGIPADKAERLFQSFSQVDASMTRRYGGTGLGLAISKQLVELMHGQIGFESEEGKGSHFWFVVPLAESSHERHEPAGSVGLFRSACSHEEGDLCHKVRILLAEDDEVNQKVTLHVLEKLGYFSVDVAASGPAVLRALEGEIYDMVFMDIQMPEMDGLEVTKVIRQREGQTGAHLPIIAITAHAMKGDRERFLAAGMDDYISKPLLTHEVIGAIRRVHGLHEDQVHERVPAGTDEIFDRPGLLRRLCGDHSLVMEIAGVYLEEVPEQIGLLKQALAVGDKETAILISHRLKGSSANVGARALEKIFRFMESAAKEGRAERAEELIEQSKQQFERFAGIFNDEKTVSSDN